jgi:Fur family transcriptional regulator, iron response regulator
MESSKKNMTCLSALEIEARLKDAGVQATSQRISICQYVLCEGDHPTADDVFAWAEKSLPKISLATVYNTLKVLVEAGLLREYRFPHTDKVIYDNNLEDHHHFLDEKSGRLFDIDLKDIDLKLNLPGFYKMKSVDILVKGRKEKN